MNTSLVMVGFFCFKSFCCIECPLKDLQFEDLNINNRSNPVTKFKVS